jgi:hypothetical protein
MQNMTEKYSKLTSDTANPSSTAAGHLLEVDIDEAMFRAVQPSRVNAHPAAADFAAESRTIAVAPILEINLIGCHADAGASGAPMRSAARR